MVKHTTLRPRTAKICRSHTPETGMTTITSNHDVPAVGQPTTESPDMYSLVNTTEKAVEIQVVDFCLPTSQRKVDSRLMSINPRDAIAPQRKELRNDGEPCYWLDMNPHDVGLDFDAGEEKLFPQKQPDDIIWAAVQRARMANHELNKIQQLEKAGLSSSTPHDLYIVRVLNRPVPTGPATQTQNSSAVQSTSIPGAKTTPAHRIDTGWLKLK